MTASFLLKRPLLWGYGLGLACFAWPLLTPGFQFYRWDSLLYTFPLQREVMRQWVLGQVPAWWEGSMNGTPLLANLNAAVFYPLKVLLLPFPIAVGWKLFLLAHLILALWGMHKFLRKMGLHPVSGMIGAFAYAFGGYARSLWDSHNFLAWAWIPVGLAALAGGAGGTRWRHRGLLLLSVCMMVWSGDPQALLGWAGVAGLWILLCSERRGRDFALLAGVCMLGLSLTAPQWLPTVLEKNISYRAEGLPYSEAVERSFHPLRLVETALPYVFGARGDWHAPGLFGAGAEKTSPWTASIALGPVLWLGLAGSVWSRRLRFRRWILWMGGIAWLLSLGRFLPGYELFHRLPLVGGFRYPEKYLMWVSLALSCGCALGVDALLRRGTRERWKRALLLMGGVSGLALGGAAAWMWFSSGGEAVGGWRRSLVVIAAGGLPFLLLGRGGWSRRTGVVAGSAFLGLWACWVQESPLVRMPDPARNPPPLVRELYRNPPLRGERFWADPAVELFPMPIDGSGAGFYPPEVAQNAVAMFYNQPWLWGIPTVQGFSPLESERMRAFRKPISYLTPPEETSVEEVVSRLRRANVTRVYTQKSRWAAFSGAGLEGRPVAGWTGPGDRIYELVVLPAAPPAEVVRSGARPPQVRRLHRPRAGSMVLELEAGEAAVLRIPETYAVGWGAVDEKGRALELTSDADGFIRLEAPGGVEEVHLQYRIPGWAWSWWLAGAGGIPLLYGGYRWRKERMHGGVDRPAGPTEVGGDPARHPSTRI